MTGYHREATKRMITVYLWVYTIAQVYTTDPKFGCSQNAKMNKYADPHMDKGRRET